MNFTNPKYKHTVDTLFVLVLFLVFSLTILSSLMYGIHVYQNVTEKTENNNNLRTGILYVSHKVRAYDEKGKVSVGTLGNCPALILEEELEGIPYETYLYAFHGELKELFTEKGNELPPEIGSTIMELAYFTPTVSSENLLKLTLSFHGADENTLLLHLHGKR